MQQCPNCGQINRAGVVFCEFCGASLIGQKPLDTKSLDSGDEAVQKAYGVDAKAIADVRAQGTATFQEGDRLRLEIEGGPEPLFFTMKTEAIFGRKDPATGAMPDIDLTPFAGYRMGVSRRHAAISRNADQGLDVRDLGSSNGTFLNGQQLVAHRLYRLRNGDELRLGQMVIRVFFEPGQDAEPSPAEEKQTAPPVTETPAKTLSTQRPEQLKAGANAQVAPEAPKASAEAQSAPQTQPKPDAPPSDEASSKPADQNPEPTKSTDQSPEPKTPPDKPKNPEQDKRD